MATTERLSAPTGATSATASRDALVQKVESIASNPLLRSVQMAAQAATLRGRCRDWMLRVHASLAEFGGDTSGIDIKPMKIGRETFLTDYYVPNKAVMFQGLASNWRALTRWNESYLKQACGEVEVEVMVGRDSAKTYQQNVAADLKKKMPMANYISLVYSGHIGNDYYIVSRNRFFENPRTRVLFDDIVCPPYVRIDEEGKQVKMWFGPSGTITPLHHDDRNNIIVQVLGRKKVRLIAPYYSDKIAQSRTFYADDEPFIKDESGKPLVPPATDLLLSPGDALFIPVGWWHAVESLDVSITLAFTEFGVPNEYGWP